MHGRVGKAQALGAHADLRSGFLAGYVERFQPGAAFPLPDNHEDRGIYVTQGSIEVGEPVARVCPDAGSGQAITHRHLLHVLDHVKHRVGDVGHGLARGAASLLADAQGPGLGNGLATCVDAPVVVVEIGADAYGFMCLTSLEYDQAYLPKEFLCLDCVRSEKTREILRKGWSKESIYLVYKTGNEMNVQEIDVSNLDSSSIITYYQSPSSNGGRLGEQTQCTRSNRARASCVTYAGGCLLLFEETDG